MSLPPPDFPPDNPFVEPDTDQDGTGLPGQRYHLDLDTGDVWEATDDTVWTMVGTIPGDAAGNIPPGYEGDNADPAPVEDFLVAGEYRQQDDGTSIPIITCLWSGNTEADILGYELQWQPGLFGDPDPGNPDGGPVYVPPDWANPQTLRVGFDVAFAALEPVIGGLPYSVRIRAYDMETRVSTWVTREPIVMMPDPVAPPIPTTDAYSGYKSIGVTWEPVDAADLDRYEVAYHRVGMTPPDDWTVIVTRSTHIVISGLAIGPAPTYADVAYEAKVRAIDSSENVREAGDPGDPDHLPSPIPPTPDITRRPASDWDVGWSNLAFASSTTVPQSEVAFTGVIAEVISAGYIDADHIKAGDLRIGGTGKAGEIRVYNTAGQPIGAWGSFGWIIADPNRPTRAIWANPQGELQFTNAYGKTTGGVFTGWDGTETLWKTGDAGLPSPEAVGTVRLGIEQHVGTTVWTTAINADGIRADAILLGAIGGGNNRALNAGFELVPPETQPLVNKTWDDATDWALASGGINLKTSGAALQMTAI